jgi:hypothetical protein
VCGCEKIAAGLGFFGEMCDESVEKPSRNATELNIASLPKDRAGSYFNGCKVDHKGQNFPFFPVSDVIILSITPAIYFKYRAAPSLYL